MSESPYKMRISLNVLNHLGYKLYSNVPAVLSEVVANSWDADATHVDINIESEKITINDNGHGMTFEDIDLKYLTIGYERRNDGRKITAQLNRPVMGRKGIGKLSLFSIANTVRVETFTDGKKHGFVMSAQRIDKQIRDQGGNTYYPDPLSDNEITLNKNGTRIVLTGLRKGVFQAPAALKKRLARRFSIIGAEYNFTACVNGKTVGVADREYFHKLQYLWYYGEDGEKYVKLCNSEKLEHYKKREGMVEVEDGIRYPVRGWIGTTAKPGDLEDGEDSLNKIVVMVRGKLAQEDILGDFTEGGLYTKYIIGEIHADFLDIDNLEDIATSNRQDIIKNDPRYIALRNWVKEEMRHIKGKWTDLRNEGAEKEARRIKAIDEWLEKLGNDKQKQAKSLLGKIGALTIEEDERSELYQYCVLAFEKLKYRDSLSALENVSSENLQAFTKVFAELDDIEATLYYEIVQERLDIINTLRQQTEDDVREKLIQKHLYNHLWLLDPSWDRAAGEAYMEKTVKAEFDTIDAGLSEEEMRGRIDIKYKMTSGKHVVIELKRPSVEIGDLELIGQVDKYRTALQKLLDKHNRKEPIDIVCIVGTPLTQWTDLVERERSVRTLAERSIRIVFYDELIDNAHRSYQEFQEANEEAGRVYELVKNIKVEIQQKDGE